MVGVLSTSIISAQDTSTYPTIVERLSEKFGLNKDEVQSVFNEVRDEHKADMYAHWAERLNDLVAEGKLTEAQKTALLDKHEELDNKMEDLKNQNLTFELRKKQMQALMSELKTWAESQSIDLSLIGLFGKGFGHGPKMGDGVGRK